MYHTGSDRNHQRLQFDTYQAAEAIKLALWGFEIGPLGEWKRDENGKLIYPLQVARFDEKEPLTRRAFYDFTNNIDQVAAWWSRWPEANIGARPWEASVVIDVDTKNGAPGLEVWQDINAGHILPETLVTKTGTGGFHFWFRLPYPAPLAANIGGKGAIDVKHHGGYVVMPQSVHPDTGKVYELVNWCAPAELPVLPKHLHRHVYAAPKRPRPIIPTRLKTEGDGAGLVRTVAEAGAGNRNNALYWAARTAAEDGLDIFDELVSAAESIGLTEMEAERTIASARAAANEKGIAA